MRTPWIYDNNQYGIQVMYTSRVMILRGESLYQSWWKSWNMKSFIRKARWNKVEGMMIRMMGRLMRRWYRNRKYPFHSSNWQPLLLGLVLSERKEGRFMMAFQEHNFNQDFSSCLFWRVIRGNSLVYGIVIISSFKTSIR